MEKATSRSGLIGYQEPISTEQISLLNIPVYFNGERCVSGRYSYRAQAIVRIDFNPLLTEIKLTNFPLRVVGFFCDDPKLSTLEMETTTRGKWLHVGGYRPEPEPIAICRF